jgi:putative addiction module component (TIGR02574 family)
MKKAINDIRAEALALSINERACLAHDLLLSLDDPDELELEPEQEEEILRRVRMVREGKAAGNSVGSVAAEIRADYDK